MPLCDVLACPHKTRKPQQILLPFSPSPVFPRWYRNPEMLRLDWRSTRFLNLRFLGYILTAFSSNRPTRHQKNRSQKQARADFVTANCERGRVIRAASSVGERLEFSARRLWQRRLPALNCDELAINDSRQGGEKSSQRLFQDTRAQVIFGKTVRRGEGGVDVLFQEIAQTKARRYVVDHLEWTDSRSSCPVTTVHPG